MIEELLSHHILDHSYHLSILGAHLPITQHSVFMFFLSILLLLFLPWAVRRKGGLIKAALEAFVAFVREEIVSPNLGSEGDKLVPFFCTLFIFLLLANYIAMVPGTRAITANISITGGLALVSLLIITGMSIKKNGFLGFFKTFVPGGVPAWLIPLLFPLELISLAIRIFVLAVRLFANMVAGHIILIGLISFIFILGERGITAGYGSAVPVLGMTLFVSILEVLVAAIQAYVFTLLTAIFTGLQLHAH